MPNAGEVDVFATADVELATDRSELAKAVPSDRKLYMDRIFSPWSEQVGASQG